MPVRQRLDANDEALPAFWTDLNVNNVPDVVLHTDGTPPVRKGMVPAPPADLVPRVFTNLGWLDYVAADVGGVVTDTKRVFVDIVAGNDATAAIGDPARPYLTAQAGYNAALAGSGDHLLRFGIGTFGTITLTSAWPSRIKIAGAHKALSIIPLITTAGSGYNVDISSDKSITISSIITSTGGGDSGDVALSNCVVSSINSTNNGGPTYQAGAVYASDCELGPIDTSGALPNGNGADITLIDTVVIGNVRTSQAIYTLNSGTIFASRSKIVGTLSTSSGSGGDIFLQDSFANNIDSADQVILTRSYVSTIGGGLIVSLDESRAGTITIGGGILSLVNSNTGNITAQNCDLTINDSVVGDVSTAGAFGGGNVVATSSRAGTVNTSSTGSTSSGNITLTDCLTLGLTTTGSGGASIVPGNIILERSRVGTIDASALGASQQNGGNITTSDSVTGQITSTSAALNGGNAILVRSHTPATPILTGDGVDGVTTATNSTIGSVWYGDGSQITNINAANIASGTLPVLRGGTGVTTSTGTGSTVLSISPTFTGTVSAANLTLSGDLTVNGTTTTVNSTTVDIADRVLHVNWTDALNAPVPSSIAGLNVERGNVAGVDRDQSGIYWDEAGTRWVVATNTGGNDATLGALLPFHALSFTGSGSGLTGVPVGALSGILPAANGGTGTAFFGVAGPTVFRTYTFPDTNTAIAGVDTAQTLTNKTLTDPLINGVRKAITPSGAPHTNSFIPDNDDYTLVCDASSGALSVTLPILPGAGIGRIYNIVRINSGPNDVTIMGDGGELISGEASFVLKSQWDSITVQSNGVEWFII